MKKNDFNTQIHSDSLSYLEALQGISQGSNQEIIEKGQFRSIDQRYDQSERSFSFGSTGELELPSGYAASEQILSLLKQSVPEDQIVEALKFLIGVEYFENFFHTKYTGQKRFSIEGCDTAIVILEELIKHAMTDRLDEVVLGMSHRGRVNALYHILHKPLERIILEFEGVEEGFLGAGDVKYHKGFTRISQKNGHLLRIQLLDNPSHLESIFPVAEGYSRGLIDQKTSAGILPIIFHGDAAFSGQGVVYESFQLSKLKPYNVSGTLHVVINNRIGFTATPQEFQSVTHCTDIAHTFDIPVFHVHADDLVGVLTAINTAYWIKQHLHSDVIIDLIGERKWGHNEGDEPAFTSPSRYQDIRGKKRFHHRVIDRLKGDYTLVNQFIEHEIKLEEESLKQLFAKAFEHTRKRLQEMPKIERFSSLKEHSLLVSDIDTKLSKTELETIIKNLLEIPEGFDLHQGLFRQIENRRKKFSDSGINMEMDWGFAESIAFSSLCRAGVPIRLIGQDTPRGTFSQRHALWIDQTYEQIYCPIQNGLSDPLLFSVSNSSLSEYAALGFEYGYSLARPEALVVWEAQFGDFANGAQIIFDQYLSASEQKWGRSSRLVVLLPHGYEGQGPEHSSCRLERFLQLSAQNNWVVAQPSTPIQYMMLLRRHMSETFPVKPLIVVTPKSLLRNHLCVSKVSEALYKNFSLCLWDSNMQAESLILCSGKVYYDLQAIKSLQENIERLSVLRIEQLYPVPIQEIVQIMKQMASLKKVIWLQEEPENMGANWFISQHIPAYLPESVEWVSISRPEAASPATGIHLLHEKEQDFIVQTLLRQTRP